MVFVFCALSKSPMNAFAFSERFCAIVAQVKLKNVNRIKSKCFMLICCDCPVASIVVEMVHSSRDHRFLPILQTGDHKGNAAKCECRKCTGNFVPLIHIGHCHRPGNMQYKEP